MMAEQQMGPSCPLSPNGGEGQGEGEVILGLVPKLHLGNEAVCVALFMNQGIKPQDFFGKYKDRESA